MKGGVEENEIKRKKRLFGDESKIEEGGQIKIIENEMIDKGRRMEEVIFEELKGKGKQEIVIERKVEEKRILKDMDIIK